MSSLSVKILVNLWERFSHIYGYKFTATFGESAIKDNHLTETAETWGVGLRELSGEQIAIGLRECVNCGEAWPPTLPEFVKMCKGDSVNDLGLNYKPPYHTEFKRDRAIGSDELKDKRKKAAKSAFSNINKILA